MSAKTIERFALRMWVLGKSARSPMQQMDVTHNPPADWSPKRKREYLEWAAEVVKGCRGVNQGLEHRFDEVLRDARLSIGMD